MAYLLKKIDEKNGKIIFSVKHPEIKPKIISIKNNKNWVKNFHQLVDEISKIESLVIPKNEIRLSFDFSSKITQIFLWENIGNCKGIEDNFLSCAYALVDLLNNLPKGRKEEKIWVG